jgi:hypothetical protein
LNPGRRGEKPAANRLSYGAALRTFSYVLIKYALFACRHTCIYLGGRAFLLSTCLQEEPSVIFAFVQETVVVLVVVEYARADMYEQRNSCETSTHSFFNCLENRKFNGKL